MMRILVLTQYGPQGPSSRVRFHQYRPYLEEHAFQLQFAPFLEDDYVRRLYAGKPASIASVLAAYLHRIRWLARARLFHLIWLEKEVFPWLPPLAQRLLSRLRLPYVVDYDDAAFHRYDMHPNPFVRSVLSRSIDTVMRLSSTTVAGNEYLATRAREAGARRIEVLPSVIDLDRYPPSSPVPHSELRVGWIGTPVTAPYLNLIRPALEQVQHTLSLRLVAIGAGPRSPLPPVPQQILPWSEATEAQQLHSLDVGIMPLPDEPFERGKCGYKLLQYMACGIPVVASPVGANLEIVEHGRNGYLASSTEEWVAALASLGKNRTLRAQMGTVGRQKVEREYSLQLAAPRLFRILQQAASL